MSQRTEERVGREEEAEKKALLGYNRVDDETRVEINRRSRGLVVVFVVAHPMHFVIVRSFPRLMFFCL